LAQSEPPEEDGPGEIGNQFNQLAQRANPASQSGRNHAEFQARSQVLQQRVLPEPQVPAPSPSEQVQAAALVPVWVDNRLLLIRRVQRSAGTSLQGCWIDWPALRAAMLSSVHDLAPGATLEKVDAAVPADVGRMLASLPARLVPASRVATFASASAPIRFSLTVAWIGTLAAALAVAGLMWGVLVLAHRRDAFVSAVTHELRTPLTTFRMYTEMLAGGMVSDEATRRRYLETLRTEADRLMHLVENVLAYARLERGRRQPTADVALDDLLRQTTPRLAQRAESAGMRLVVRQGESTSSVHVRCDVGGVEQILFNLVDNACKYASVPQGVIELEASIQNGRVQLCVSDSGPGISRRDARRLFRSFRKSASEAAQTAPGVGLGLALSRRLARQQSGDLRLLPSPRGACFALTLPTTDP
jgi:signal transduction histidine kinase